MKEKKTTAPKDFTVSPEIIALAKNRGWPEPTQELVEHFLDWHKSHGSLFADWDAALRNWLRNAKVYTQDKPLVRSFADRRAMPVQSIPPAQPFTDKPISDDERARVSEMISQLTHKMSVGGKR